MTQQTITDRLADKRRQTPLPTVERRDITVIEETERRFDLTRTSTSTSHQWEATLDGRLSTGENVEITRTGGTFAGALSNLEDAIAANGWVIQ